MIEVRRLRGLWNHRNAYLGQKFCNMGRYHDGASIYLLSGLPQMTFSEPFNDIFIKKLASQFVLMEQILCERFPFCQKKTNQQCFDLRYAHSNFLWSWRTRSLPLLTLPLGLRIVFQNPKVITTK